MLEIRAKNSRDLTGIRFGSLVGIKRVENLNYTMPCGKKKKRARWLFKCDCGNEVIKSSYVVVTNNTSSCGCRRAGRLTEYNYKNKRLGPGIGARNALMKRYQAGAKKRNIAWELTVEDFSRLTSSDCYYCGTKPFQISKGSSYFGDYTYNGIDRRDNTKPYSLENSVPCCGPCNLMKMDLLEADFIKVCERIYKKSLNDPSYKEITDNRKVAKERNHFRRKKIDAIT